MLAACCPPPFSSKLLHIIVQTCLSSDRRFVGISPSRPKTFVAGSFDSRFGVPSLSQLVAGSFDSRTRVIWVGCQFRNPPSTPCARVAGQSPRY